MRLCQHAACWKVWYTCQLFFVDGANWLSPGHHTLTLTCGPAGNRTATGSLSATSRTSPYQLLHRDAWHTCQLLQKSRWICSSNVKDLAFALLQRYFQVSPKLLRFGEACPGVLKVSCSGVSWPLRNLATSDKCVNDFDLL